MNNIVESLYKLAIEYSNENSIIYLCEAIDIFEYLDNFLDSKELLKDTKLKLGNLVNSEDEDAKTIVNKNLKNKSKLKTIVISATIMIAIIFIVSFYLITVYIPQSNYNKAITCFENGNYKEALNLFEDLKNYENSAEKYIETKYLYAKDLFAMGHYEEAYDLFEELAGYKDSEKRLKECKEPYADLLCERGEYQRAALLYYEINNKEKSLLAWKKIKSLEGKITRVYSNDNEVLVGLTCDNTLQFSGVNKDEFSNLNWKNITKVVSYSDYLNKFELYGLDDNGNVFTYGELDLYKENEVKKWEGIKDLKVQANYILGLKTDGTVETVGMIDDVNCDLSEWRNIEKLVGNDDFIFGIKMDGKIVSYGDLHQSNVSSDSEYNHYSVDSWEQVVDMKVSSAGFHVAALLMDGTVNDSYMHSSMSLDVSEWKNIIQIEIDEDVIVGLTADGKVLYETSQYRSWSAEEESEIEEKVKAEVATWTDIIEVKLLEDWVVGLKANGTVLYEKISSDLVASSLNLDTWKNIKAIYTCGGNTLIGIKSDGTAMINESNSERHHDISLWKNCWY